MNSDKTIKENFINKTEYPIWYYKELAEVDIDYVIAYLLKKTFIVEIDGSKHEITFGYNKKENYVGQCIKYDDIKNSKLCSFEVINKGFKEGRWFIITDKDTTNEFKADYIKRKEEYKKEETKQFYIDILSNAILQNDTITTTEREYHLNNIKNYKYEVLEDLFKSLMNKINKSQEVK